MPSNRPGLVGNEDIAARVHGDTGRVGELTVAGSLAAPASNERGRLDDARRAFANGRAAASLMRDPHLTGVLLNWKLMEVLLAHDADQQGAQGQLAAAAVAAWG